MDYQTLSGVKTRDENTFNNMWWKSNKSDRAATIASVVKRIAEADSKRQTQYQINSRLYGNMSLIGVNGISLSKLQTATSALKDRVSYNVIQAAIDTVTAKIAKNKPRAMFLTSGGDWNLKKKAERLEKFVDGIFYDNDFYDLATNLFRDGAVFGDGVAHVFERNGSIKIERVLPSEMFTDIADSWYGKPRQLHRVKAVDRQVLIEAFPSCKDAIKSATATTADISGMWNNVSDQVTVCESWHLPSGKDASDGIHCITIENKTLFEEEWTKDYFPFARFSWSKRLMGYWSQSAAEQIQNIQLEINKTLWTLQRSFHLAGTYKVLVETGSKIVSEHLTNDIGAIIHYTGTPPTYVTPPIIQPEIFQQLTNLKNLAFEQVGVSQLSATSQKPAGLNSGKALREYNDIESDRFMTIGQAYERFCVDVAKLCVKCASEIYERDGELKVKVPGKKFIETIDWSEIDLSDDMFLMKAYPVSSLPNEPAGRLQTVQEYMQAGILSPQAGRRLLDFPDIEQVEEMANSEEDYLNKLFEDIFEKGIYAPPEPEDDRVLARSIALSYYAKGKLFGVDQERLEMVRTFVAQLDLLDQKEQQEIQMQQQAMMAQQQAQQAAAQAPQAAPMPQPRSDLVPNVAGGMQ